MCAATFAASTGKPPMQRSVFGVLTTQETYFLSEIVKFLATVGLSTGVFRMVVVGLMVCAGTLFPLKRAADEDDYSDLCGAEDLESGHGRCENEIPFRGTVVIHI
jgi:hypothetical protein